MVIDGLVLLKVFHVACASVWFGASWLVGGDILRTLDLGRPHVELLPGRVGRLERVAIPSGLLTLVTGVVLVILIYGATDVPWRLHVVFTLVLLTMLVGGLWASPAWRRVKAEIERGAEDLSAAKIAARQFERAMRLEHLLRFATLIFVVGRESTG